MAGTIGQASGPPARDGISNAEVLRQLQKQGVKVSLSSVEKWRTAGMPGRDPGRMDWIKANRPKQLTGVPEKALEAKPEKQRTDPRDRLMRLKAEEKQEDVLTKRLRRLRLQGDLHHKDRLFDRADKNAFVVMTELNRLPWTCGSRFSDEKIKRTVVELVEECVKTCCDSIVAKLRSTLVVKRASRDEKKPKQPAPS